MGAEGEREEEEEKKGEEKKEKEESRDWERFFEKQYGSAATLKMYKWRVRDFYIWLGKQRVSL
jgi:hypothetical protein